MRQTLYYRNGYIHLNVWYTVGKLIKRSNLRQVYFTINIRRYMVPLVVRRYRIGLLVGLQVKFRT